MSIRSKFINAFKPSVGKGNQTVREAWLKKTISEIPAGLRILDAGAGTQRYKKFCDHLKYVSQDFAQYDGKGDSTGLQTGKFDYDKLDIVSDIKHIPEPDNAFDVIMCIEVFEHLPDPVLALKEFARLLKPGGELIITAPFSSLTHFAPYHFITGFNRYWYKTHIEAFGMEIYEIEANGNFFEYIAQEIYRIPSVSRKYAGQDINLIEYIALLIIQKILLRRSLSDQGSWELLCYGYHVRAKKGI